MAEPQALARDVDQRLGRCQADKLTLEDIDTALVGFVADALEHHGQRRAARIQQVRRDLHDGRIGSPKAACLHSG